MATTVMYIAVLALMSVSWTQGNANEILINMDKDDSPKCGEVVVLQPGQEVRLKSKGLVPNGYCGASVFTPETVDNYTCDALCVTFKTASMSTCQVKLKFVGHRFGSAGDLTKEFNCHDLSRGSFCWPVSSMAIEVIEKYQYAYVDQRRLYEFDVDINARCTKNLLQSTRDILYRSSKEKMAEEEYQTYVEGIAVGVSLACVFLIVLFIMWCYTKHQAVASSPSDMDTPVTSRKKNLISTFRTKLRIGQNRSNSNEPEATYRKNDTSTSGKAQLAEPEPELAPLTTPTKETEGETFELAKETLLTDKEDESAKNEDETAKLNLPEVVVIPGTPEPKESPEGLS